MIKRIITNKTAKNNLNQFLKQPYIQRKELMNPKPQILYIVEVSENDEACVSYDVPRPWGDGDFAWIPLTDLFPVELDINYKIQKRRDEEDEEE